MKRLSNRDSVATLYVDAGDFLSPKGFPPKDRFILRAYTMINYDAICIGDQEFVNGVEYFSKEIRPRRMRFISSTLTESSSKRLLLPPYVIRYVAGLRIAFIGVVSNEPFEVMESESISGIEVRDAMKALKRYVNICRRKADLVVVLSHLGIANDRKIPSRIQGIDILIGSHSQTVLSSPEKHNNTIIVQAGKNSEFVGLLNIVYDKKNKNVMSFEGSVHPVLKDIPGDPAIGTLIQEYRALVTRNFTPLVDSSISKKNIVSSKSCAQCHKKEWADWEKTAHGQAFSTLQKRNAHTTKECLSCHTTGMASEGGFTTIQETPAMINVGCVECHQVESSHATNPKGTVTPIDSTTCLRCHTIEQNPEYRHHYYYQTINHQPHTPLKHTVVKGESLRSIAQKYYGDVAMWKLIYYYNKTVLDRRKYIQPEQIIFIPGQQ